MSSMDVECIILHVLYCNMNIYSRLLILLVKFILLKQKIYLSRTYFVYISSNFSIMLDRSFKFCLLYLVKLERERFTLTTVYLVKYSFYHFRFIFVCVCLASVCSSLFLAQRKTLIFICCMNKCMNAFSQLFRTFCCRCAPLQDQKSALLGV